jgi:hypothetical protein
MILRGGEVTLLYTVRYGSHAVYGENYAVLTVWCKSQDSVFLRLTVRCDTVRYGNLLQYYNTVYTTGYTDPDHLVCFSNTIILLHLF